MNGGVWRLGWGVEMLNRGEQDAGSGGNKGTKLELSLSDPQMVSPGGQ